MSMLPVPRYLFCPVCGNSLEDVFDGGRIRRRCKMCRWIFYPRVALGVTGVLYREGSVVLVRRRFEPFAGSWMFPSGFVEYGEHPNDAIVREFVEETGLAVGVAQLIGVFQSFDDSREPGHLSFAFSLSGGGGMLENDADENDEVRWWSVHNPPEIRFLIHKHLIEVCRTTPEIASAKG